MCLPSPQGHGITMLILGCAWTSHGARALDAPPSAPMLAPRRPQVGSHLRQGPGWGEPFVFTKF